MNLQINMTPEETNFLRFTSLVLKIAPRAVRREFDMLNHPNNLNKKIDDNKKKLADLLNQKIISKDHWDVLFPANKHASSRDFDITLMVAFLREISGMKPPQSGWNTRPAASDYSAEADLVRIKYYRNEIAHAASCSINSLNFSRRWDDLSKAVIRIGGESFRSQISAMLSTALDASYHDLYRELRAMKEDIIPQNIKFLMDCKIEDMAKKDKIYVPTKATKSLREAVNHFDVVMMTGPPGSGKTSTVNHIALHLQEEGYKICPVVSTKEIIDYWMPEIPQVFVLNDPFGIHDINQSELHQWMAHSERLNTCIRYSNMKILATIRSHIIKDKQISENVLFPSNLKVISLVNDDIALSNEERLKIFNAHAQYQQRDDLKDMGVKIQNFTISCFPLLCKIYTSDKESKFSDKEFFKRPLSLLNTDIEKFKINDPARYFCLLYCMVNDNNIDKGLLGVGEESKRVKTVRKILLEKCELPSTFSREKIKSKMNTLLNTYLKQEGNSYQFIHDIIHDAVIRHVNGLSSDFKRIILKNCNSKFLNERIRLSSVVYPCNEDAYLVLNSGLESEWGARILQDIKDGHWKDLVNNTTLHDDRGDMLLAQSFKNWNQTDFQNIISFSYPEEIAKLTLQIIQNDSCRFILEHLNDMTILHLIVCLGLKHCLSDILKLKSISVLTLHQLKLNLLLLASITGKTNIAGVLLANRWNPRDVITECDMTFPYVSSFYGHEGVLRLLITHGAEINKRDKNGQTPLLLSSRNGHVEVVKLLLSHEAGINKCDRYGQTPLLLSSQNGHVEVVKLLLSHKADVDKSDRRCYTPLLLSSQNGHVEIVKLLLSHKAEIDNYGSKRSTPLLLASENGHVEIVKLLLSHKADVNNRDYAGQTPLLLSSQNGHVEIVKLLLSRKARVNNCDYDRQTPLLLSSQNGHVEVVKLLLSHEAGIDICDWRRITPLLLSSQNGHVEIVKLLLSHKADVNGCDGDWQTPLLLSSQNGRVEIMKLLLSHNADINKCDKGGQTPILLSSQNGHVEVVKLLLSHKADINICDKGGQTPLSLSSQNGHAEVVKLLLSHKAG